MTAKLRTVPVASVIRVPREASWLRSLRFRSKRRLEKSLWRFLAWLSGVVTWPALRAFLSREYTDYLATRTAPRPRPFSLWSTPADGATEFDDYTAWPSLTDKEFSGRHLPAAKPGTVELPANDGESGPVTLLFARQRNDGDDRAEHMIVHPRSSLLFMFFAQWFTDSIFRTHPDDLRKTNSTHYIDLCQIYGQDETITNLLRSKVGGKLHCHAGADGETYPDRLFEKDGSLKEDYLTLPHAAPAELDRILKGVFSDAERQARQRHFYATGLDRGNSSVGYVALSTIFLREHNRLCELLAAEYRWSDERLFQTARVINITLLLKLVVEEYINHILGFDLFRLEAGFAERREWYRPNWMALEFNLLYRWHGLVPNSIDLAGAARSPHEFRFNNELFEQVGVETVLSAASCQHAGRIGLGNTPAFLLPAERSSVRMARHARLQGYNAYRKRFSLEPLRSFEELVPSKPELADRLRELYVDIDRLEYLTGIFAEEPSDERGLFGDLMANMVAYDALTQIYSNPLLAKDIYGPLTFSEAGLRVIEQTGSFHDLVRRNVRKDRPVIASLNVTRR